MSKVTNRIRALEEAKKFRDLREKQLKQMKNATSKYIHKQNLGKQHLRNKQRELMQQRLRQPLRGRVNQTRSQINSSMPNVPTNPITLNNIEQREINSIMPNVPTKPINSEKIKEQGVEKALRGVGTIPTHLPTTSSGNKDKDAAAAAGIGNNNFEDLMNSETNSSLDDSLINFNIDSANNVPRPKPFPITEPISVKKAKVLYPKATELYSDFDSHNNNIGSRNTNSSSSSSSSSGISSSGTSSSGSSSSSRSSSGSSSSGSSSSGSSSSGRSSSGRSSSDNTSINIKIKDDPRFQKYFTMLRTGVPKSAVISEMETDGVDSFVLDADPESIFNNNTISTFTNNNNNNNNNRISALTNNANYNGTPNAESIKPKDILKEIKKKIKIMSIENAYEIKPLLEKYVESIKSDIDKYKNQYPNSKSKLDKAFSIIQKKSGAILNNYNQTEHSDNDLELLKQNLTQFIKDELNDRESNFLNSSHVKDKKRFQSYINLTNDAPNDIPNDAPNDSNTNTNSESENKMSVMLSIILKSKMGRILLFLFIFFFIFKVIRHILTFFDISHEMGYTYFIWLSILVLLFALLPVRKSYL